MDAREIRVGNLLYDRRKVYEVDIWAFAEDRERGYFYKGLKPIPLTEQWLKDFGFDHDGINGYKKKIGKTNTIILDSEERCHVIDESGYGIIIAREIIWAHQLQNLYFSLTGKELKLKSK